MYRVLLVVQTLLNLNTMGNQVLAVYIIVDHPYASNYVGMDKNHDSKEFQSMNQNHDSQVNVVVNAMEHIVKMY